MRQCTIMAALVACLWLVGCGNAREQFREDVRFGLRTAQEFGCDFEAYGAGDVYGEWRSGFHTGVSGGGWKLKVNYMRSAATTQPTEPTE